MKLQNDYLTKLGEHFSQEKAPEAIADPELLIFNDDLAAEIGFKGQKKEDLAQIFAGNKLLEGSKPLAMAYAGHQFGHFVPQLGDGRAVLLGEVKTKEGLIDVALKGSGRTYFSRNGDGKCPLFAAIKEYIFSEFLHHLGVKAARSLAVVKTNEFIIRQQGPEPGAVITRIAQSHIRIGTFQFFAARGDLKNVKKLADYAINRHYPECKNKKDKYLQFFKQVAARQIDLVSDWLSFGFIHGVMNSDNILICGQAIDFGPCAFMERFDYGAVYSAIDRHGRYAYDQQKQIILWNLTRLAESILPLINDDEKKAIAALEEVLRQLSDDFDQLYYQKMAKKIGIEDLQEGDRDLIDDFLIILAKEQLDFTNSFRQLPSLLVGEGDTASEAMQEWLSTWRQRFIDQDRKKLATKMNGCNPFFVPRNYQVIEIAQKAVNGDVNELQQLLQLIKKPYLESKEAKIYTQVADHDQQRLQTFCGT